MKFSLGQGGKRKGTYCTSIERFAEPVDIVRMVGGTARIL
jgi:hypothetical protein